MPRTPSQPRIVRGLLRQAVWVIRFPNSMPRADTVETAGRSAALNALRAVALETGAKGLQLEGLLRHTLRLVGSPEVRRAASDLGLKSGARLRPQIDDDGETKLSAAATIVNAVLAWFGRRNPQRIPGQTLPAEETA